MCATQETCAEFGRAQRIQFKGSLWEGLSSPPVPDNSLLDLQKCLGFREQCLSKRKTVVSVMERTNAWHYVLGIPVTNLFLLQCFNFSGWKYRREKMKQRAPTTRAKDARVGLHLCKYRYSRS